jgi:hypothetical protein
LPDDVAQATNPDTSKPINTTRRQHFAERFVISSSLSRSINPNTLGSLVRETHERANFRAHSPSLHASERRRSTRDPDFQHDRLATTVWLARCRQTPHNL